MLKDFNELQYNINKLALEFEKKHDCTIHVADTTKKIRGLQKAFRIPSLIYWITPNKIEDGNKSK